MRASRHCRRLPPLARMIKYPSSGCLLDCVSSLRCGGRNQIDGRGVAQAGRGARLMDFAFFGWNWNWRWTFMPLFLVCLGVAGRRSPGLLAGLLSLAPFACLRIIPRARAPIDRIERSDGLASALAVLPFPSIPLFHRAPEVPSLVGGTDSFGHQHWLAICATYYYMQ